MLAATHPARVNHLSVIDVVPPGGGLEQAVAQPNVGKLWFFHFMAGEEMPEVLTAGKEREYLTWFYDNFAVRREALTQDAVDEYVRRYSSPGGMRAGFAYYRAFTQDIERAVLEDTGHYVAEEQPEKLSRLLLDFFSR